MPEQGPHADLSRRAADQAAATLRRGHGNPASGPAPGDIFVLRETSEEPVQWVVLARDPAQAGRFLTVSADANGLLGTGDLEVGDEATGPLVIRRPYGGWLEADRLQAELRVGSLRLDQLRQAREHWFSEDDRSTVAEREVDEDPEYQYWRKSVLDPAFEKLFAVREESDSKWHIVAVAAALLMTGAGFFLWQFQSLNEIRREKALAEQNLNRQIDELRDLQVELANKSDELREQQRLVEKYEEKLAKAGDDPGLQSTLGELRKELMRSWRSAGVVNPIVAILKPVGSQHQQVRGRDEVKIGSESSHLVLLLEIPDDSGCDPGLRFRFEVQSVETQAVLWHVEGLEIDSLQEVKVGIPARLLDRWRSIRPIPQRPGGSVSSEPALCDLC